MYDDGIFFGGPRSKPPNEQKARTRKLILAAASALIRGGGEEAVTMEAVAFEVEVSERTVHRHFQTRDDLINAVWQRVREVIGPAEMPRSADDLVNRPRRFFPRLNGQRNLVRAYLHSRATRGMMWEIPAERRQRQMMDCVRQAFPFLPEESLRRRTAIIDVISSACSWERMSAEWGLSGTEAGEAAAEAIEILFGWRVAD